MRPIVYVPIAAAILAAFAMPAAATDTLKLRAMVNHATDKPGRGDKWIEIQSYSWGQHRAREITGGGKAGKATFKEFTVTKKTDTAGSTGGDPDRPLVTGRVPAGRGSLTARVPAGTCRVGARYPAAELGSGGKVYRMQNVVVTGCTSAGLDDGSIPTETLSLNFDKVI